ncbi:hemerythrin-like metal-binding protein [Desulfatibacillum aliphaticivorans]|uniref:Hemerythrin-like metal-binding protein n=1 Tax=Desulfatibacillum aliphaticivorans TaxID=218208 RepID=B8FKD4_DESAL|nr:bacteriohemerythrin [Desulfatibacillum aliphaticivorans]ACL01749.1 hemerythrin-like metal-binding protein [Desulfatibacillum aliphaticivorans]
MAFFNWEEKYSVGVPRFDNEHKKLIDLTNRFYEAMKVGKARDAMQATCNELVAYTKTHFNNEEMALKQSTYPNLASHQEEHRFFTKQVMELKAKLDAGEPVMASTLGNFLKNWLVNHIMGIDKTYQKYLR